MSKLLSTPALVLFLCAHVTSEREIILPPPPQPPPPLPPESATQNNAHFNMCRGARNSIVLAVWNIRHITSCILPLPGRWLQRRIVSGMSRNLLCGGHFYLLVILYWFIFFPPRCELLNSNRIHVSLCIWLLKKVYFSLSQYHFEVKLGPSDEGTVGNKAVPLHNTHKPTYVYFHILLG